MKPKVKIGDILKLAIARLGDSGDPILMYDGFVIILKGLDKKGAHLNKLIDIKITKVLPNFAFAEVFNGI